MKKSVPTIRFRKALHLFEESWESQFGKEFQIKADTFYSVGKVTLIASLFLRGKNTVTVTRYDFSLAKTKKPGYCEFIYYPSLYSLSDTMKIQQFVKIFGFSLGDLAKYAVKSEKCFLCTLINSDYYDKEGKK